MLLRDFVPTTFELARTSDGGPPILVGNAEPGAIIELVDGTLVVAAAEANERGEWILAPIAGVAPGRSLAVRTTTADGRFQYLSAQMIVVGKGGSPVAAASPRTEMESGGASSGIGSPAGAAASFPDPAGVPVDEDAPELVLAGNVEISLGASAQAAGTIEAPVRITIGRGDTLWDIAERYLGNGTRYPDIVAANPGTIRNPARLRPGDVLILPVGN